MNLKRYNDAKTIYHNERQKQFKDLLRKTKI